MSENNINEKVLDQLVAKLDAISPLFVERRNLDQVIEVMKWFARVVRLPREDVEEKMECSKCHREFEWNGKDAGELIRVRGYGMVCKSCLKDFFMFNKEGGKN